MELGQKREFLTTNHLSTKRDYQARATDQKPKYTTIAKKFDQDYWDGSRDTGYGGYQDDGRWKRVVEKMVHAYELSENSTVLDVGCGKGYFLREFKTQRPLSNVRGVDVSSYALQNAPSEIKPALSLENAKDLSFEDKSFDLVVSMNTLHNLPLSELIQALKHIERVSKKNAYICVESYRSEEEKWNLMRWQLTCESFYTPKEWEYVFKLAGYRQDYEFIFFE